MNRPLDISAQGFSHIFKVPWPVKNGLTEIKNAFKKGLFIFNSSLINWSLLVSPRELRLKECVGCNSKTVCLFTLIRKFLLIVVWGTHSQVFPSILDTFYTLALLNVW